MKEEQLFSKAEYARYNRHIIIPGFGIAAQEKMKKASVLVVGAGGLGSPVLLYLAAAGIGTIGIVDCDVVEDSNLQRQVLYGVADNGMAKTEVARARLEALNPYIRIRTYPQQLSAANAMDIIADYDLVADGTDNFPTRYLVNDACVLLGKTNVYASIYQFEGHVSVFNYLGEDGERGPNYRDLFPVPPEPGTVANCSEAGVLGVLPGIIGSMQALEAIKVICGIGAPLSGRFYTFDALSFESRTFNIKRNADNPLNGTRPVIRELIDYEQFCGMKAVESKIREITPAEFWRWQQQGHDYQLIDVREPEEYDELNIEGLLLPMGTLELNSDKIARNKDVVIHCKMGGRSARAIRLLEDQYGFTNLYNLEGGIIQYLAEMEMNFPQE